MKGIKKHLAQLMKIERKKHHPLIHKIHKKYKISRRTLLYVKEYGIHSNVPKTIIKESIKVILLASIISSIGGFSLESIKEKFIAIMPFIILMPILNDIIGDYGTVISSRFSTYLHTKGITKNNKEIKNLMFQILIISAIVALSASILALTISYLKDYQLSIDLIFKVIIISLLDTIILVFILFFTSIFGGIYFYKRGEDPDNFLIPITTSIADLGNMLVLTALILIFF